MHCSWSRKQCKTNGFRNVAKTLVLLYNSGGGLGDSLLMIPIIQWLKDYTLATCKYMLGEARSKFATVAGPQGGTSLNGDALKAEAIAEIQTLDEELKTQVAGGQGYGFSIG